MISLNCELCLAPPGWAVAWLGCCLLDTQVVNVMMKPDFSPSFLHPLLAGVQLAARGNICCYEPIWRLSPPSPNMRHFTQLSHISSIARRNEMGNFLAPWPRLSPLASHWIIIRTGHIFISSVRMNNMQNMVKICTADSRFHFEDFISK